MKRMKLRDQFVLRIAWSPSLLGDQAIKNNKKKFLSKSKWWLHTYGGGKN
jgi:hypothetical protein